MKKNGIAIALTFVLALGLIAPTAYAATSEDTFLVGEEVISIQPWYTNITTLSVSLNISSSGYSTCYGKVNLVNSTDTSNLSIELQQKSGSTWSTIKTWDTTGSNTFSLEKNWYVSSGYTYRILVTAKVYNSSGTLQETASSYSSTVAY